MTINDQKGYWPYPNELRKILSQSDLLSEELIEMLVNDTNIVDAYVERLNYQYMQGHNSLGGYYSRVLNPQNQTFR